MSLFGDQVRAFSVKVEKVTQEVFVNVCTATRDSIVEGSPVTGAPGQPVDTGALRESFALVFESPTEAVIRTNLDYAPSIEDGLSYAHGGTPMTLRSAVGGFHGVRQTVTNFDLLVAAEAEKVKG